ncbi:hypothetical protein [Nocardioides sp.]|uniref:hypothetical protein n=1 Tax=Nocardioides sp. TaxID=35761 RepID=UPI002B26D6E9|nr:hypothetical protein [Nocardioides sp.]
MQVTRFRQFFVSTLAGGVAASAMLLAPAAPVAASPGSSAKSTVVFEPLDIVLLGDSYSAGNGATNEAGQAETYGPTNCYRSKVNWAEKYAVAIRAKGIEVNLANHACSGGKAADIVTPRVMDVASDNTSTPFDVTTLAQADAYLAKRDLCNTQRFPDEEFWTYKATAVDAETIEYDCSRTLRPQVDFITPETDLVLFTMGGNDAGFSAIVTQCFILKDGNGCKGTIDAARAKLPAIQQLLLDDIDAIRDAGLREDAKIVQLGYPYLQTDNDYMAFGLPPYAAGDAVRTLIDEGTVALAEVATLANVGHSDQMTFVTGVKEAFAGHEPDATTPVGNRERWVNQVADGSNTSLWYHPNGLGQTAYAEVLIAGGDYGATPFTVVEEPVTTQFSAAPVKTTFARKQAVRIRTSVTLSDGSRPSGVVAVTARRPRTTQAQAVAPNGRNLFRLRGLKPGKHRIKAVYNHDEERTVVRSTVVVRRSGRN